MPEPETVTFELGDEEGERIAQACLKELRDAHRSDPRNAWRSTLELSLVANAPQSRVYPVMIALARRALVEEQDAGAFRFWRILPPLPPLAGATR
jgi:hypothetical protein